MSSLKISLAENTDVLSKTIAEFPDEYFNAKINPDTWSAGEVLEHIYRAEFGIPRLFNGESQTASNRDTDFTIQKINQTLLDFTQKRKAGGVVLPKQDGKDKAALLQKFQTNRQSIANLSEEKPLDELCLKYENPIFGYLTRREWIHFIILHTERHLHQIQNIKEELKIS